MFNSSMVSIIVRSRTVAFGIGGATLSYCAYFP